MLVDRYNRAVCEVLNDNVCVCGGNKRLVMLKVFRQSTATGAVELTKNIVQQHKWFLVSGPFKYLGFKYF